MGAAMQVRKLDTVERLREHLDVLGVDLPIDDDLEIGPNSPLGSAIEIPLTPGQTMTARNRWCILPMEGWDGTLDGRPTELVERRWRRFGESGAALIWGGEAVAVRHDGRANPNQLRLGEDTVEELGRLRRSLIDAHRARFGTDDGLVVGLQLTHSGRWARPAGARSPLVAYRHPVLDRRVDLDDDRSVLTDRDLDELIDDMVTAAALAAQAGFSFVDLKHCHGYLGHELLSAVDRPGRFGGDLTARAGFLLELVRRVHAEVPGLGIGVRLSAFDLVPHHPTGELGIGTPEWPTDSGEPEAGRYRWAFGGDGTGLGIDLTEPLALLDLLAEAGVHLLCITAGSPYYVPHVQRPAYFPPSDGYTPPEDPLVGVARLLDVTTAMKRHRPDLIVVGSGYSYLQEWVAHVAQAVVRHGGADLVGLGRMALSYHDLPADALSGATLDRRRICRTFSDCTTAPRNGVVSGCYPLDGFYKERPERRDVATAKRVMVGKPARATTTEAGS